MKFKREDFFSIPNILTYIRILLVPVFILVFVNAQTWVDHIWAVAIILISAATDIVDGYIARRFHMITDWGKVIDPVADKAMQGAMMFCILVKYPIVLILIVLYAIKEFASLALSAYLLKKGKHIDGARWYGKLCTVVLYIVMLSLVIFPIIPDQVVGIMIGASAAFMILAFALYMNEYFKLYAELKREEKEGTYEAPEQIFYFRKKSNDIGNAEEEESFTADDENKK